MTKSELLRELATDTWAALKPSPVHGIGVFALRDIPKGCKTVFSRHTGEWIPIPIGDIEQLPAHARHLVETYCLYDDQNYFIPDYGFKLMDIVLYLNHSSDPNIISINDGEYFETTRDIPAGTELLVNYGELVSVEGYD